MLHTLFQKTFHFSHTVIKDSQRICLAIWARLTLSEQHCTHSGKTIKTHCDTQGDITNSSARRISFGPANLRQPVEAAVSSGETLCLKANQVPDVAQRSPRWPRLSLCSLGQGQIIFFWDSICDDKSYWKLNTYKLQPLNPSQKDKTKEKNQRAFKIASKTLSKDLPFEPHLWTVNKDKGFQDANAVKTVPLHTSSYCFPSHYLISSRYYYQII